MMDPDPLDPFWVVPAAAFLPEVGWWVGHIMDAEMRELKRWTLVPVHSEGP